MGGRGFFKPESEICAVTYHGLVNAVDIAKDTGFKGRFVLLSGMGSELPSFTGRLLYTIRENLQRNERDRNDYLRNSGLDWCVGRSAVLRTAPAGRQSYASPHRPIGCRSGASVRADFARALIVAADAPVASRRMFDVFNAPGQPPADGAVAVSFGALSGHR